GIKDVFVHFAYGTYDREKSRDHTYETFKNAQCQKCHRNILNIPDKRGAMLAHRTVLYPKEGYEKKCVDCHRNLVHMDSEIYRYKEKQPPYRGLGI
ncbi:MAG: NapC/NirT family cytochrome c, partial [Desulfobacter sp.]